MKKRILIILGLVFLMLFSTGCAVDNQSKKKEPQQIHTEEFTGKCLMYIDEIDGYYYPTIYGDISLSRLPQNIYAQVAGTKFKLEVKSTNISSNGLYILSFKQTHLFGELSSGTYSINLIVDYGRSTIVVENCGIFNVDTNYSFVALGNILAFFPEIANEDVLSPIIGMRKDDEWITSPVYK